MGIQIAGRQFNTFSETNDQVNFTKTVLHGLLKGRTDQIAKMHKPHIGQMRKLIAHIIFTPFA